MCIPYCTEFGYYLLDGIDRSVNNIALIFVVWTEVVSPTTAYRWADVTDQVGAPAWYLYNFGYFAGQAIGVGTAQGVNAGAGLGLYVVSAIAATFIPQAPTIKAPPIELRIPLLGHLRWVPVLRAPGFLRGDRIFQQILVAGILLSMLFSGSEPEPVQTTFTNTLTQGSQLRRDLNIIVGLGRNWEIPAFLPILLRYVSGPVLAIIFSFAYPEFQTLRNDPMMISGFILAHIGIVIIIAGYILPRYYDSLIPPEHRGEGTEPMVPAELKGIEGTALEAIVRGALSNDPENGLFEQSSGEAGKLVVKDKP